jgi:hypothetical protein
MAHPLDGAVLRLNRADRHLSEADKIIMAYAATYVDHVVADDDGKTVRFPQGWPPIPAELSVVVSDAIHNMRAALDYIVYELALEDSGKIQSGTQFLIEDIKSDPLDPKRGFDARSKQYLKGLEQCHIDMIEGLQPYKGIHWTKTLRDISNPDKHRTLTALSSHGRKIQVAVLHRPSGKFPGELKMTDEGPMFDRFDLEFDAHDAITIAPADPSKPALMATLRILETEVCGTIELFKPEFTI